MADDWNLDWEENNPIPEKLRRFQEKMNNPFLHLPSTSSTPSSTYTPSSSDCSFQKCYLIDSKFRKLFCDSKGTPWKTHPLLDRTYTISSTDSSYSMFTKITVSTSSIEHLNQAVIIKQTVMKIKQLLSYSQSREFNLSGNMVFL